MWRRKRTAAAAAAMMAAALVTFPAAAHGHGHHRQAAAADTSCPVCAVEGCTESGRHTHDGHDYCGYNHSSGYCDGSCQTASGYGGCHGCHR